MTETPQLTWGLIGASDIAETRMLPALRRTGQRVQRLASSHDEHVRAFRTRNEIPSPDGDYTVDSMLADPTIDAVYVSSTNDQHLAWICRGRRRRRQARTVRKAAVNRHRQCPKLTSQCEAYGIVLGVNHHLPAAGTHRMIRTRSCATEPLVAFCP